jgi:UDP-N-acetylmuramate dehydrogenase
VEIENNISLQPYNTFGIDVKARYFSRFNDFGELQELAAFREKEELPWLILGGGSNILFTKDVDGLAVKNEIRGIHIVKEDEHHAYVQAGAGENWHSFVQYCISAGLSGVENLSLIPGNVGASPMQNIGAYGVEIKDMFHSLEAFHVDEKKMHQFSLNDCEFGYRESVFKRRYKDQFVICSVTYRLNKQPVFNTSYGAIVQELEKMGVQDLSVKAISEAVIRIRQSKLPDPKVTGNAGSFFKNPEVTKELYLGLKEQYPDLVGFDLPNGNVKLAAGWLIEHCGPAEGQSWKGYRKGDAGCHARQALVLVNYGHASGEEIYNLSTTILQSVLEKFGVVLEREVNVI